MLKDNQKHNESVAPNSAFLSELQRALPEFFLPPIAITSRAN